MDFLVKIGVLDYAQIDEGKNARQALQETIELAKIAEKCGFKRFWVAEHHDVPAFANSSPELLMMKIADATNKIRVGSGGVMIPHYSPYKVAENIRLLEAFHPNRIDLGIGNNSGTPIVNGALNETKSKKLSYEQSVTDLLYYLNDTDDESHRFHGISANPVIDTKPEMFLLSTGMNSAKLSAAAGIGYTFGLFPFVGSKILKAGPEAAKYYREAFVPSPMLDKPFVSIAPFVAIADTEEEAEKYAVTLDLWLLGKENFGAVSAFPSYETAKNYPFTRAEQRVIERNREHFVVGVKESVKEQLEKLVEEFGADELLLIPLLPGFEARKRAYELLAEIYVK